MQSDASVTGTVSQVAGCTGSGHTAAHAQTRLYERVCGKLEEAMRWALCGRRSLAFGAPPVGARARQRLYRAPGLSQAGVAGTDRGPAAVGALRPWQRCFRQSRRRPVPRVGHSGDGERAGGEGGGQRARSGPGPARVQPAGSGLFPWRRLGRIAAGIAREGGGFAYELPPGARSLRRQLAAAVVGLGMHPLSGRLHRHFRRDGGRATLAARGVPAGRRDRHRVPAYFGSLQLIEALGLKAVEIPAVPPGHRPGRAGTRAEVRRIAAVLAVTNFSNPLGA